MKKRQYSDPLKGAALLTADKKEALRVMLESAEMQCRGLLAEIQAIRKKICG